MTPKYLQGVGLIDAEPPADADIALLLRQALDKVAFLPFGLVIDKWRWERLLGRDFARALQPGLVGPEAEVPGRRAAGAARRGSAFDPGAKYHVPGNTPYMRYFLADVLQFQFHRALAETAGEKGPLHRLLDLRQRRGRRPARATMLLGASRPWPEALATLTGRSEMDATAVLDYFAPLKTWLDRQNAGQTCGWK